MGGILGNVYSGEAAPSGKGTTYEAIVAGVNLVETSVGTNNELIIPTVLKVSTEEIAYWSNMTCLYDKNWEFDQGFSTVPIAFMHITSIAESITAQGAEKRVIVYQAPATAAGDAGFDPRTSNASYKNNLEVIMDNVVVQPKQYQMEVIIPDSLIGPYHKQGLKRLEALMDYMSLTTTGSATSIASAAAIALQTVQTFVSASETAASLADLILGATTGSTQMATINKNSLEAMAKKGHVVLFKKWTGYTYSYGLITKIDMSKRPNEEGVYRGSITFQETPILNISKKNVSSVDPYSAIRNGVSEAARIVNISLALPFMAVTGVMDEAGSPGTDNNYSDNNWSASKYYNKGVV